MIRLRAKCLCCGLVLVGCVPGRLEFYQPSGADGYLASTTNSCYANAPSDVWVSRLSPELEAVTNASKGSMVTNDGVTFGVIVSVSYRSSERVEFEAAPALVRIGQDELTLWPVAVTENADPKRRYTSVEGRTFVGTEAHTKFARRVLGYRGSRVGGAVLVVDYQLPEGLFPDAFSIDLPSIQTVEGSVRGETISFNREEQLVSYSLNC